MLIPLDQLEAHPANANVMPERLLMKLQEHVRTTGRYPALIVRPLPPSHDASMSREQSPSPPQRYQILDGHHRALVLQRLGHPHARCDVWHSLDDSDAAMLLLTLNRLHGEDDPRKRGALLSDLARVRNLPPERLAKLLPDDVQRIERLMSLARGRPAATLTPADLPDLALQPQAVTFFLTRPQRMLVLERLRSIDADRTTAFLRALDLCEDTVPQRNVRRAGLRPAAGAGEDFNHQEITCTTQR
jgi:ParB-like chromosome segregation protein Spo0J